MKPLKLFKYLLCLWVIALTSACAPIKNLEVWKSDDYSSSLTKVLVIALAQEDVIRKQLENVIANHLEKQGVEGIPSHKILPHTNKKPEREVVLAKVRELGIEQVLVIRSISKEEITNHQYGGVILGGVAIYDDGWYGYGYGFSYNREYDTTYFTVATKLFDVDSKTPVWSYIAQVRVEGSRQGAVNLLVPKIVEQLEVSQLLPK